MRDYACKIVGLAVLTSSTMTLAGPVTLEATNRGWAGDNGIANGSSQYNNYYAGYNLPTLRNYRNWIVFDLSGVAGPISSATLLLDAADIKTPDPSETYQVTSTSQSAATLVGGGATYGLLGVGTLFGDITATTAQKFTTLSISLNAAGLAHLNASLGGSVAFSGRITTLSGQTAKNEAFFWSTDDPAFKTRLQYEEGNPIPLPTGAALAMVGMGVIGVRRKRN